MNLDARLRRWVRETPDALAIVGDDESVTWRELDARVEAVELPPPGHAIGWLGHNSIAMLATFLACARRGVVFVPLNVRLAEAELEAIVEHAGIAQVVGLAPAREPQRFMDGDLLLAYTSGTTGTPKGALHTQAAMLANIDAAIATQGFDQETRCLSVLPLFHVGGLCIQTLPLLVAGGTVRLHSRFDPGAWLRDVAQWKPTTSLVVPAVMRALVEHPEWAATDLSSLRFVGAGSSIIPRALIEAFHARGVRVSQIYGATETGPVSVVLRPDEALAHVGSAGRPAPGVEVRIVGGGDIGELWIKGSNLMRGYHREPDVATFRDGWFHSGDLGRIDAEGYIEIVGRSKDMIISGGENIYPAEIENLLADHPDIAEAAVVGIPDPRWGEVPVLAVVPRPGRSVDLGTLSAAFEGRLARYKQPRQIVIVDTLAKTALGKVRKPELAQQIAARLKSG